MACSAPDPKQTPPQKNQETGQPPPPPQQPIPRSKWQIKLPSLLSRPPASYQSRQNNKADRHINRFPGTNLRLQIQDPPWMWTDTRGEPDQVLHAPGQTGDGGQEEEASKQTRNGKKRRKTKWWEQPADRQYSGLTRLQVLFLVGLSQRKTTPATWTRDLVNDTRSEMGRKRARGGRWTGGGGKRYRVLDEIGRAHV